jgi:hypothetical protein
MVVRRSGLQNEVISLYRRYVFCTKLLWRDTKLESRELYATETELFRLLLQGIENNQN